MIVLRYTWRRKIKIEVYLNNCLVMSGNVYYSKYCLVPQCESTSKKDPNKLFLTLPKEPKRRKLWLQAMRRNVADLSKKTVGYVCEDHFNLEEDVENYTKFKLMGGRIFLKSHIVPHIFDCQKQQKRKISSERTVVGKRARKEVLEALLTEKVDEEEKVEIVESQEVYDTDPDFEVTKYCEEYLTPSKSNVDNKWTQTDIIVQRTVGVQHRCSYRSKYVQTDISPLEEKKCVEYSNTNLEEPLFTSTISNIETEKSSEASSSTCAFESDSSFVLSDVSHKNSSSDFSSVSEKEIFLKDRIKNMAVERSTYLAVNKSKLYLGLPQETHFVVSLLQKYCSCEMKHIYLTLMKIKTNLSFELLGDNFGVGGSESSKIFQNTVPQISACLKTLIVWPSRESIKKNLPIAFRHNYSDVQSIIDCFEIQIEKPSDPILQAATWSEYKKANTMKYLISSTPDGVINYISKGFGGRTSDVTIVKESDYLSVLPTKTSVMADRGFKRIDVLLMPLQVKLIRPPSVKAGVKCTKEEVLETKRIAALRIHIERVIRRLREFQFLKPHACVNRKLIRYLDHIVIICCALVNLQPSLIKK